MEASQGAVADLLGVEGMTTGMVASGVAVVEASAMIPTNRQRVAMGARSYDHLCMSPPRRHLDIATSTMILRQC